MHMAHMLATESREKSFMGEGIPLLFCTQWIRHYMKNRAENGAQIHKMECPFAYKYLSIYMLFNQ